MKTSSSYPAEQNSPSARPNSQFEIILLAVVGMSPAVLTETIWALARPENGPKPIVPAEVIAITTVRGQHCIQEQLLTPTTEFGGQTVWQALRQELLGLKAPGDPRLNLRISLIEQRDPVTGVMRPLEDIRHREDNLAAVPFAPLRVRFPDIADIPTRFRDMVQTYSNTFKRDAATPALIVLLNDPPRVVVDGLTVELEGERQLAVIRFLLETDQKQWLRKDQAEAAEIFKAWHGYIPQLDLIRPVLRQTIEKLHAKRKTKPGEAWIAQCTSDDIKRPLSFLRTALVKAHAAWVPPQRDLRLPPFRLAGDS